MSWTYLPLFVFIENAAGLSLKYKRHLGLLKSFLLSWPLLDVSILEGKQCVYFMCMYMYMHSCVCVNVCVQCAQRSSSIQEASHGCLTKYQNV